MQKHLQSALNRLNNTGQTEHPAPELLAALAERTLPRRERNELLEHLSRCPTCRECMSLAQVMPNRRKRPILWIGAVGIAASLCVFALLSHLRPHNAPAPQPQATPPSISAGLSQSPTTMQWRFEASGATISLEQSSDGGKSWKASNISPALRLHSLAWSGPKTWLFTEDGKLLESKDSGARWKSIPLSANAQKTDAEASTAGSIGSSTDRLDIITPAGDQWTREGAIWHHKKPQR